MPDRMLEGRALSLTYKNGQDIIYAVRDVNLTIGPNQLIGILGPSGSGKSSLLYLLSGIKIPSAGEVLFHGKPLQAGDPLEKRRRYFGFVFQQYFLINYVDVLGNVMTGAVEKDSGTRNRAKKVLIELGLAGLEHRKPYTLSIGQRQRVAIARAFMNNPEFVFADEPTANLDHTSGQAVMELLNRYKSQGTVVVVSHDETMLEAADTVYRMWDGRLSLLRQREP